MSRDIDLVGQKFNRLTVMSKEGVVKSKTGKTATRWICKCDCGNTTSVTTANLKYGSVKSCGCLMLERSIEANTKHGDSNSRLYKKYRTMCSRCNNKNNSQYKNYGGRGIKVYDKWLGKNGYKNFKEWAYSNGYREDYATFECTLDRINVDGNYEPNNCRWVDTQTQNNNKRNNINITFQGETHTLSEWGRIKPNGLSYSALRSRLRLGWSIEDAFTKPSMKGKGNDIYEQENLGEVIGHEENDSDTEFCKAVKYI